MKIVDIGENNKLARRHFSGPRREGIVCPVLAHEIKAIGGGPHSRFYNYFKTHL
jgi:hypothetical protein